MNYKIINGIVLGYDNGHFFSEKKTLYISDGMLAFDKGERDEAEYEIYDASGKCILPGLINMHTHAYMSFFRNYADDVSFDEWLFRRIMPVEDVMTAEDAYWTSMLSCMEMIGTGTTCFADMHMFEGKSALAAQNTGMRAYIGRGLVGSDLYGDGRARFEEAMREKEAYESRRIRFVLSPHAIYSCSEKMLTQIAEAAGEKHMRKQIHLSESVKEVADAQEKYGRSPVELVRDTGLLDENCFLAHCVHVSGQDMEIIRETGASVVTNPASNAKLGNGAAPVTQFLQKGINVCLGTDSAASNNTLNMFREMGFLSLMHKAITEDSSVIPAECALKAATVHGAKALGMEGRLGVIREGACADLIFLDLYAPSLFPNNAVVSSLCYSANGSEVDSVMIDGAFVMKNREYLTLDKERVFFEVSRIRDKYLQKG